jgi:hypothetical protein
LEKVVNENILIIKAYSAALAFGAGLTAAGALAVLGVAVPDVEAPALASPAKFFLAPDLKSVSYQPPPFKRNPAAEICFFNAGFAQAGQSTKRSSLNLCSASNAWPQTSHWYSYIGTANTSKTQYCYHFAALDAKKLAIIA